MVRYSPRPSPRRLTAEDAGSLAALHGDAFHDGWSPKTFSDWATDPRYRLIGIEADGKVAAMLVLRVVAGEAEIITITTSNEYRRMGLARHLLSHACEMALAEGVATFCLEVSDKNKAARMLYESMGFTLAGQRKAYYRTENTCCDAVLYRLNL